ncbi:MAG: DMT family transporter [Alphaproteobacteria bacterium]|nr:DMT family transporter [Alphaproteobacteria bacterium]
MTTAAVPPAGGRLRANLALLGSMVVWATNFPVTEALLTVWDAYLLAFVRLGVSVVFLFFLLALREGRAAFTQDLPWGRLWILGGAGAGVSTIFLTVGVKHAGAVMAAMIAALMPIIAAIMARFLFRLPLARAVLIGAALAVAGGVLAALGSAEGGLGEARGGELLMLISMILWVWYSEMSRHWLSGLSLLSLSAYTMLTATLTSLAVLPVLAVLGMTGPTYDLAPPILGLLLYLGAGPVSLALLLWHYGVQRIGIAISSIYRNLVPVVVVLIAVAFGRYPTAVHLMGGALMIAGVLYAQIDTLRVRR